MEAANKCDKDCLNCPYEDCICDTLDAADYRELWTIEAELLFPKTQKQKKLAAYKKAYREQNREKVAAYKKAYREQNREKVAAYMRKYRRKYNRCKKQQEENPIHD